MQQGAAAAQQRRRPHILLSFLTVIAAVASTVMGGAGGRLLSALSALPHRLLPRLVHVGRQVVLPQRQAPAAQRRRRREAQAPAPAHDPLGEALCPTHVSGYLSAHRMVSYRLRLADLYGTAA